MSLIEILKAAIFGVVEGITEWLPISSTGHMILLDEFLTLHVRPEFLELFLVVVQLGAIMAVVIIYWKDIMPFHLQGKLEIDGDKISMWCKIAVASIPAAVIGLLFDDYLNAMFYNYFTVAIMLILFGAIFIFIEYLNRGQVARISSITEISYWSALFIGVFQMIAAVFPGTSRSGATIIGALLIGISRVTAAEFTFFLAIPAMFGGSAIKLMKFGMAFTGEELFLLLIGMIIAFIISMLTIKFLMIYIKKHDFTSFGWYRIVLGLLVIIFFQIKY